MDVEAQVMSLMGEMDPEARGRVLAYLQARYQQESTPRVRKAARKVSAARIARVIKSAEGTEPVTVAQAAKAARTQKATIYTWIKRGKLKTTPGKPYRDGFEQLVSVADVRALVKERQ